MTDLRKLEQKYKVWIRHVANEHYQIKGAYLVNYYPDSKNKTAYISCTVKSFKNIDWPVACIFAHELPLVKKSQKAKRKSSYKAKRKELLKKYPYCHWCGAKLSIDNSSIEHVIPLSKGGLDNMNNYALACIGCNK